MSSRSSRPPASNGGGEGAAAVSYCQCGRTLRVNYIGQVRQLPRFFLIYIRQRIEAVHKRVEYFRLRMVRDFIANKKEPSFRQFYIRPSYLEFCLHGRA